MGTRIACVRIKGPVCNIFYIVVYIPHKGRTCVPFAKDTIQQLRNLLSTVRKSDCVILEGDFNCQLRRNVPGCTGKWSMTTRPDDGHEEQILDLMRENDLFAAGMLFKPKKKISRLQSHTVQKWQTKGPGSWTTFVSLAGGNHS